MDERKIETNKVWKKKERKKDRQRGGRIEITEKAKKEKERKKKKKKERRDEKKKGRRKMDIENGRAISVPFFALRTAAKDPFSFKAALKDSSEKLNVRDASVLRL